MSGMNVCIVEIMNCEMCEPNDMELVAMVMGALPTPPMPMLAGEEVPDEITVVSGDMRVCNTHDLMGMLLLTAMSRKHRKEDIARQELQKTQLAVLLETIDNLDENDVSVVEKVYDAFAAFTRGNIKALSSKEDVRFPPLASIMREDRVHIASCHHAASQDVIFGKLATDGDGPVRTAEEYSQFSYPALLMRQFARIRQSKGGLPPASAVAVGDSVVESVESLESAEAVPASIAVCCSGSVEEERGVEDITEGNENERE